MDDMAEEQVPVPVDYKAIHAAQRDDAALQNLRADANVAKHFLQAKFGNTKVWTKQSKSDSK